MKTKLFTIALAAGMLSFNACKNEPNPEVLTAVAGIGTTWTDMSSKAQTIQADLEASVAKCAETCGKHANMSMDGVPADLQAKCTEAMTACKNDMTALEGLKTEWAAMSPQWGEVETKFNEFKEKVTKGEVSGDEATKTIEEFKTKMAEGTKGLEDWSAKLAAAKETCTKNEEACNSAMKMVEEAAAKAPKKK